MADRNRLCTCGSGKKFMACCYPKRRRQRRWIALGVAAAALVALAWVTRDLGSSPSAPPAGKVWSEEHGHWHDAPAPGPAPPGPPPAGKVWSEEHGHWHDSDGTEPEAGLEPPGPPPPGKLWSAEHGHWHDAPGEAAAADLDPAAPTSPAD